jgi:hypothetical protein
MGKELADQQHGEDIDNDDDRIDQMESEKGHGGN